MVVQSAASQNASIGVHSVSVSIAELPASERAAPQLCLGLFKTRSLKTPALPIWTLFVHLNRVHPRP
jgi:hypothetical protein